MKLRYCFLIGCLCFLLGGFLTVSTCEKCEKKLTIEQKEEINTNTDNRALVLFQDHEDSNCIRMGWFLQCSRSESSIDMLKTINHY